MPCVLETPDSKVLDAVQTEPRKPPPCEPPVTPRISFDQVWDGAPPMPWISAQASQTDFGKQFRTFLAPHVDDLLSLVARAYEKDMWYLQGENLQLRQRLSSIEGADTELNRPGKVGALLCVPSKVGKDSADTNGQVAHDNVSTAAEEKKEHFEVTKDFVSEADASPRGDPVVTPRRSDRSETGDDRPHQSVSNKLWQTDGEECTSSEEVKMHSIRSTISRLADGPFGRLQRWVMSNNFEMTCGSVILANTLMIALQLQFDGFDSGYALGVVARPSQEVWPGAQAGFLGVDVVFNCLFIVELFLRAIVLGRKSVYSAWMWFDTIIVVLGMIDLMSTVTSDGEGGGLGFDPTMIRVVRLVRLVRLFKILKAMSSFDSLFLLIKAIQASWVALTWSFLILGCVQVVVGLFLCQMLNAYIDNEEKPADKRREIYTYFGTFSRTMITMFEITLANWVPSCRKLMENVHESFILFYIVYRCMFCFAVLKVIAAVFITETNRVLESDDELTVMKAARHKKVYMSKLKNMFEKIDQNGDGAFDWPELQELVKNDQTATLITTLGFERHDFEKLFWLLDDGSGEIKIDDFVSKVGKMKGQAKTIDILTMLKLTHRMEHQMHAFFEMFGKRDDEKENVDIVQRKKSLEDVMEERDDATKELFQNSIRNSLRET